MRQPQSFSFLGWNKRNASHWGRMILLSAMTQQLPLPYCFCWQSNEESVSRSSKKSRSLFGERKRCSQLYPIHHLNFNQKRNVSNSSYSRSPSVFNRSHQLIWLSSFSYRKGTKVTVAIKYEVNPVGIFYFFTQFRRWDRRYKSKDSHPRNRRTSTSRLRETSGHLWQQSLRFGVERLNRTLKFPNNANWTAEKSHYCERAERNIWHAYFCQ